MRFQVPQFIEIEDKVVGPLTFKQFVYIAGGGGLVFVLYRFLPFLIALPLIAVTLGLAGALAFYKVNNKPFVAFLESAVRYAMSTRLYIWRKEAPKVQSSQTPATDAVSSTVSVPKISDSKLRDLAWVLDVEQEQ